MPDMLYEWLQNMVFFLLIAGAVLDALPGNHYRKYIRFFSGTILLLLMVSPLLKLGGLMDVFDDIYQGWEQEQIVRDARQMEQFLEEADLSDYLSETGQENKDETADEDKAADGEGEEKIEVEEIRLGE